MKKCLVSLALVCVVQVLCASGSHALNEHTFIGHLTNPTEAGVAYIKRAVVETHGKNPDYRDIKQSSTGYLPYAIILSRYPQAKRNKSPEKTFYEELAEFFVERGEASIVQSMEQIADLQIADDIKPLGITARTNWAAAWNAIEKSDHASLSLLLDKHSYLVMFISSDTRTSLLHKAAHLCQTTSTPAALEVFKVLMGYGADYHVRDPQNNQSVNDIVVAGHPAYEIFREYKKAWRDALNAVKDKDIHALDEVLADYPLLVKGVHPEEGQTLLHIAAQHFSRLDQDSVQMFTHLMRKGANYQYRNRDGESVEQLMTDKAHDASYLFDIERKGRIEPSFKERGTQIWDSLTGAWSSVSTTLAPYKKELAGVAVVSILGYYLLFSGKPEPTQQKLLHTNIGQIE